MSRSVVLSAITPSNLPTLGNYLGALRHWVRMQDEAQCYFMVADLHAITVRQDPKELQARTLRAIAEYLAAGIHPPKSTLFVQSHVPEHAELTWILTCFATMGELSRMTQFKDKSAKEGTSIPAGLFSYPVLMAADILLYGTQKVPVGEDQKQHIELTRDLALRLNHLLEEEFFVVPEPTIPPVGARIMSLQNPLAKMSKSDPDPHATIYLSDSDDLIRKKLKRAVTDSGSEIADSDDKPGVKNLLTIQSALTGKSIADIVQSYQCKMYGHLKVDTAELVVQHIGPLRDRANAILENRSELDRILKEGAEAARAKAQPLLTRLKNKVGFIPAFRA